MGSNRLGSRDMFINSLCKMNKENMKDEAYTDNAPNLTGYEMVCTVTTVPMIQKVELKLTFISYVVL